jgi:hypothetical protein
MRWTRPGALCSRRVAGLISIRPNLMAIGISMRRWRARTAEWLFLGGILISSAHGAIPPCSCPRFSFARSGCVRPMRVGRHTRVAHFRTGVGRCDIVAFVAACPLPHRTRCSVDRRFFRRGGRFSLRSLDRQKRPSAGLRGPRASVRGLGRLAQVPSLALLCRGRSSLVED